MVEKLQTGGGRNRGIAPTIGLVVLIGMVVVGMMLVLLAGATLLDSLGEQNGIERAELSMVEAKSQLETLVYQDDSPVTVALEDGEVREDGEIVVTTSGTDADGLERSCSPHTVALGALVEETESDAEIVYQSGGVWRTIDGTSTMVSEPTLRYETEELYGTEVPTVHFPITTIEGNVGGGDTYVARKNSTGMSEREFREEICLVGEDPIRWIEELEITVRDSMVIDAWERFLRSEFDDENATVERVGDAVTVTITWDDAGGDGAFVGPIDATIPSGLTSIGDGATNNRFTVTTPSGDPDWITVDGNVTLLDGASVDGYLSARGEFVTSGGGGPDGCPEYLFANGTTGPCPPDGESDVESIAPIDDEVTTAVAALDGSDDPTAGAGTGTLETGQYYTDSDLDLTGTIDTTGGPVEIGIDDGSTLTLSDLEIVGSGAVRIYATGDIEIAGRVTGPGVGTGDGSETGDRDEDADADEAGTDSLWVYGTSAADVTFAGTGGDVDFDGVVYAPGDGTSDLRFDGTESTDIVIEGAVVGGALSDGGDSHVIVGFDDATRTTLPVDEDAAASATLGFVHHEVGEQIERSETAGQPIDVVFVVDRSGSMDPPDNALPSFVQAYGEQYEPVYEGPAAGSPLFDESDGVHRTYEVSRFGADTPRHRIYVDEGGDWVHVDESTVGSEVDRECTDYRFGNVCGEYTVTYDVPNDQELRVTQAGYDPAGVRVDATKGFIDGALDESLGDRAGYVDFNLNGHVRHDLSTDLGSVRNALTDDAGGGTDIAAGIRTGLDLYDGSDNERVMVVLGDGENDVPGKSTAEANADTLEAAEEAAAEGVTIYTVGLGDSVDQALLGEIAEASGGEYYAASDAEDLEEAFERAAEDIGSRDERYIEHKKVETIVSDGRIDPETAPTYELAPDEPREITFVSYDCDETRSENETDEHDGKTYEHRSCVTYDESSAYAIDSSSESVDTSYTVYQDGDELEDYEGGWWQDGLAAALTEEGLVDEDDSGELVFDLEPNEHIIVVQYEGEEMPTGYAVMRLTTDVPEFVDESDTSRLGSNTYLITIHETEITIEG